MKQEETLILPEEPKENLVRNSKGERIQTLVVVQMYIESHEQQTFERGCEDNVESIFPNEFISFPRTSSVNTTKINKIF